MPYKLFLRRYNSSRGFLLVELLIAFGVLAFVFPLALFYVSHLIGQAKAACVEMELREAAINMKTFLDVSEDISSLAKKKVQVGAGSDGNFSVYPLQGMEENTSSVAFIAEKCDTPLCAIAENKRRLFCSPNGGTWILYTKESNGSLKKALK